MVSWKLKQAPTSHLPVGRPALITVSSAHQRCIEYLDQVGVVKFEREVVAAGANEKSEGGPGGIGQALSAQGKVLADVVLSADDKIRMVGYLVGVVARFNFYG
jgi:hypothetical protein